MPDHEQPEIAYWTRTEVARFMRVSARTVRRWGHTGRLTEHKSDDGTIVRYDEAEVRQLLKPIHTAPGPEVE